MNKKNRIEKAAYLSLLFCMSLAQATVAQVYGCKDPLANNFNAAATVNDGSCTYNATAYTPPIKVPVLNDALVETSALQMAGNFLWTLNDGGEAAIYRIDTVTNAILQKVSLAGAGIVDWEDMAFDGTYFYVGDFGNNLNGARTDLMIYKFPYSSIPDHITNPVATVTAEQISRIRFYYSDQPQPPQAVANNNTAFDCEAMIVDGGKIHLFSKNWISQTTTHYVINGLTEGNYVATPLETLATNYMVTGADKASGKNLVALLGYNNGTSHFIHLLTDYTGGKYFNGNKRRIDLPNVFTMGQAEGITLRTPTYGYISNEKVQALSVSQKLRAFEVGSFVGTIASTIYLFNGNGNWDQAANWNNNIMPPSMISSGSEIIIDPLPGGKCILNVPYTMSAGAKLTVSAAKNFIVSGNLILH